MLVQLKSFEIELQGMLLGTKSLLHIYFQVDSNGPRDSVKCI